MPSISSIVTFAVKPAITYIINESKTSLINKFRIKYRIRKIQDFNREYDNTSIDTMTFQNVLNSDLVSGLIYNFVFTTKNLPYSRAQLITRLSEVTIEEIIANNSNRNHKTTLYLSICEEYFKDLIVYLESIRDKHFTDNERQIISVIQNHITESREDLKNYLEQTLDEIQQKQHLAIFTEAKMNMLLSQSVSDLSRRYIPEANVSTRLDSLFQVIAWEKDFIDNMKSEIYDFNLKTISLLNLIDSNTIIFEEIKNLRLTEIKNKLSKMIGIQDQIFLNLENDSYFEAIYDLASELEIMIGKYKSNMHQTKNSDFLNKAHETFHSCFTVKNLFSEVNRKLLSHPYMVIYGEGGIGKSHSLAENASVLKNKGHEVLLFLGQHLKTTEDPFTQLFRGLDYRGTKESFLNEFNNRGIRNQRKTVIMIDALNEGSGKHFWKEYFLNFLNHFKEYSHIAVVFSIRSNFIKSVLPENIEEEFPIIKVEHLGLSLANLEDLIPFFDHYGINLIDFPSFELESRNPLFLHTYCEVLTLEEDKYGGWSIFEVLRKYIDRINNKLATDMRFRYLPEVNLIDKILKAVSKKFLVNKTKDISLSELYDIIMLTASRYTDNYRELVNGLIEENILSLSTDYNGNEIAYFTYERFADIYMAMYINSEEMNFRVYVKEINDENYSFFNGVLEGLSIVLPETKNIELFDIFNKEEITLDIAEAFVTGLSWRSQSSITSNTNLWIEKCLNQEEIWLSNMVYIQLLKQSYLVNSSLNSLFLHKHLNALTMEERDSSWTQIINDCPQVIEDYIDLVLKDDLSGKHLKYENYKLMSLACTWILSSTNRELRDSSTHALVKIFLKYPKLLSATFKKFEKVNDPYIIERLLASAYGTCLRIKNKSEIKEFSDTIYKTMFMNGEVYPNILVRDYARGIILAAYEHSKIDNSMLEKISPPYNSSWYDSGFTIKEIDEKVREFKRHSGEYRSGFEAIVKSLTTEYGRGVGMYGDFGRYVLGSTLKYWDKYFNDQELSNIIAMRIIDYGYSEDSHGYYDSNISSFDRHQNSIERIGKKYQWIAMFELLAKLSDNYPMSQKNNQMSDVNHFNGPWSPFLRDIDPSLLINHSKTDKRMNIFNLPKIPDQEWVENSSEVDKINQFIAYNYEGEIFVSLGQMSSQRVNNEISESGITEFFVKSKAVFIPTDKKTEYIRSKIKNKDELSVNWPNSYSVFAFEHYQYPAYRDEFYQPNYRDYNIIDALWEFTWENNTNYETHERITSSILFPNKYLVEYYNLTQISEGIWVNEIGKIVAFDIRSLGYEQNLLIRKDLLDSYLKKEKLSIVWDFYVEKKTQDNRKDEWLICWENGEVTEYKVLDRYSNLQK